MPDRRTAPVHAVPRPRLLELLDAGVQAPLTVLIAPAGSGKTVLLSQWAQSRPDLAIAWFEVTDSDRDAARFARRFAAGLADAHPACGTPRSSTISGNSPTVSRRTRTWCSPRASTPGCA